MTTPEQLTHLGLVERMADFALYLQITPLGWLHDKVGDVLVSDYGNVCAVAIIKGRFGIY